MELRQSTPFGSLQTMLLTSVRLSKIHETPAARCRVLHNLLNLFFTEHTVLLAIVGLNDYHTDRTNTEKVTDLQRVRCRRVLTVSKETACSRMTRKGFGGRDDPEGLGMSSDQQLTGPCV